MSHFGTYIRGSLLLLIVAAASFAHAARGGGGGGSFQLGVVGGLTNTTQDYLNLLQSRANTRAGGISTGALNSAYEAGLQAGYRFSGSMTALLLRPTFFYQKASGGNSGGDYNYGVTGFTVFPILRLYPLENDLMRFFVQFGLGYGRSTTTIQEQTSELTAVGNAFGTLMGMGAAFCFNDTHCITVEGNYRYLTMERNVVSDTNGPTFNTNGISQGGKNQELEMDGDDVFIRMGGMQFLFGYTINF